MAELHEAEYLAGTKLRGNDYSLEQIAEWFEAEKEGYSNLRKNYYKTFQFEWHDFYFRHGWSRLASPTYESLLAIGASDGQEILPVANRFKQITILEPSEQFVVDQVGGVPVKYVKPQMDGVMPFADRSFDVISCFGTLHHIPNVSKVISEFARVLRPGGYAIIREPIVSMDDWRRPRAGLTKNERGIPLHLMRGFFQDAGLHIEYEKRFGFPVSERLAKALGVSAIQSRPIRLIDNVFSRLFAWNHTYFATNVFMKLRCAHAIWVIRRPLP